MDGSFVELQKLVFIHLFHDTDVVTYCFFDELLALVVDQPIVTLRFAHTAVLHEYVLLQHITRALSLLMVHSSGHRLW